MKKLNPKLVTRGSFHDYRSYQAALFAVDVVNNMVSRSNKGDIIFEYENIVQPEFSFEFHEDGSFMGLRIKDGERSYVTIIGDVCDAKTDLIYATKRDVREYFKLWRIAKVVNVSRVTDITR